MSDEQGFIFLVQQYANKFGITFSSSLMDNEEHRARLLTLMGEAISGKRGPVTDEDVTGA
ncbi:hypothetical protein LG198_04515 [Methylobacillus arboreus]|uniref:hypothetical protein n=1 Tax=Methylobacillus arboreus TaxID=755170 RepID=UPI001E437E49|nr:hypothetical protein [Methylobacillus arboreus]MCB5189991.1 hypothetical protein [Methylobacillus arboreus]